MHVDDVLMWSVFCSILLFYFVVRCHMKAAKCQLTILMNLSATHAFLRCLPQQSTLTCNNKTHKFTCPNMRSCGLPQQWPCPRAACRIAFSAACRNMNSCGLPQHTFVRLAAAMIMRSCGLPQQWPCARAACRNMNSCGLPQQ